MHISPSHLRAALAVVSLIGMAGLFLADLQSQPVKTTATGASELSENKKALLEGKATNAFVSKNTLFFTLTDHTGSIKIVKFNPEKEDLKATGTIGFVRVIGRAQKYENEQEIIAQEVEKIE
ncbi:MAG: OB-fold nucleic acid binding domain-containing protein [Candidatus Diapherotrites archaeon]|nr:OB-fold nucleic acid binding domain-containing protein [Candidatus Diapherotrites archaeon]